MCGIAGFVDFTGNLGQSDIRDMVRSMDHRGPDDRGYEVFTEDGILIGMGQARLSIIDLSSGGHQPMQHGHLTIVFNGEIYNYQEIRHQLEALGHQFASGSDTEVILHAYSEWGLECISRFIGMFAFVIFDRKTRKLILVRDRVGVKPLYYSFTKGRLVFGSELKSLMACRMYERELDRSVLPVYFNHGYIPSPRTIFQNTYKLEAGHYIEFSLDSREMNHICYWNILDHFRKPKLKIDYQEAKQEVERLLISACNYRMVADVPVGIFLSGGYDSVCVASILSRHYGSAINTFTIGFEIGNNEAPAARKISSILGTIHHEHYCSSLDAQSIIRELPYVYDEPFADSSAIPTILISRVARQKVTVALSADGGDEVFGGYTSYRSFDRYVRKISSIPRNIRGSAAVLGEALLPLIPSGRTSLRHKLYSVIESIGTGKDDFARHLLVRMKQLPENYRKQLLKDKISGKDPYDQPWIAGLDPVEMSMALDYLIYLEGDILTKVDRATMSASLEGREPLLDHRICEFAATLPLSFKYGQRPKQILRDIVHGYVDPSLMDRPKTGFTVPVYDWLQGDLGNMLDEYLAPAALKRSGCMDEQFVGEIIAKFRKGDLHHKPLLWKMLMFQMWHDQWM
jgi:asparagine synthase (glutamine-hydrolysing)